MPKRKRVKRRTIKRKYRRNRKGNKLKKWAIGLGGALAPAAIAVGIGTIKQLLRKNTGYSDILA